MAPQPILPASTTGSGTREPGAHAAARGGEPCVRHGELLIDADSPVIVLPAYGRQPPDATALLALWLAGEGLRVLVHGDGPATAFDARSVLADLGVAASSTAGEVASAWCRRQPAFVPADRIAPALGGRPVDAAWLEHASLLDPIRGARSLRVVGAPDRAAAAALGEAARHEGLDLMVVGAPRGTSVSPLQVQPRIDTWIDGIWRVELSLVERAMTHLEQPLLPAMPDTAANAVWVQSVLSGERPLPLPIGLQVERLTAAMHLLEASPPRPLRNASHRPGASACCRPTRPSESRPSQD